MAQIRPIHQIAREIEADWKKISPYAEPYLRAMKFLNSINDYYLLDSAKSVVSYFLANATTWKGEKARAIKQELRSMCNG